MGREEKQKQKQNSSVLADWLAGVVNTVFQLSNQWKKEIESAFSRRGGIEDRERWIRDS